MSHSILGSDSYVASFVNLRSIWFPTLTEADISTANVNTVFYLIATIGRSCVTGIDYYIDNAVLASLFSDGIQIDV